MRLLDVSGHQAGDGLLDAALPLLRAGHAPRGLLVHGNALSVVGLERLGDAMSGEGCATELLVITHEDVVGAMQAGARARARARACTHKRAKVPRHTAAAHARAPKSGRRGAPAAATAARPSLAAAIGAPGRVAAKATQGYDGEAASQRRGVCADQGPAQPRPRRSQRRS